MLPVFARPRRSLPCSPAVPWAAAPRSRFPCWRPRPCRCPRYRARRPMPRVGRPTARTGGTGRRTGWWARTTSRRHAVNQLEMWQAGTFDPRRHRRASCGGRERPGFNTVRVFLHHLLWDPGPRPDYLGRDRPLRRHLGATAQQRRLFVLFDSCWDPHPRLGRQPAPRAGVHNSRWVQSPRREPRRPALPAGAARLRRRRAHPVPARRQGARVGPLERAGQSRTGSTATRAKRQDRPGRRPVAAGVRAGRDRSIPTSR